MCYVKKLAWKNTLSRRHTDDQGMFHHKKNPPRQPVNRPEWDAAGKVFADKKE